MMELYIHCLIYLHDVAINYVIKYRDKFTFLTYHPDRTLDGPQSRSRPGDEQKKAHAFAGNQTLVFQHIASRFIM
jgi:hypothetical protein